MHDELVPEIDERRRISPWWLILGVAVAGAVALVVAGVLAAMLHDPEKLPTGLATRTMPDGSLLVLEAVTFGTRHEFAVRPPRQNAWTLFEGPPRHVINTSTLGDRIVVWMSCRDPSTGLYREFDWWQHSAVFDGDGCEFRDDNATLHVVHPYGGGSTSGTRPLDASGLSWSSPMEPVIASSVLSGFRPSGSTFALKVYDLSGAVVAEFDVEDPRGALPVWTPDPLPIVQTDGDVSLTLKGVSAREHITSGDKRVHLQVDYDLEILQEGQPTDLWEKSTGCVHDALGNQSCTGDTLCPHEAAWRTTVRLFRKGTATFTPDETWTIEPLKLPAKDTAELQSLSREAGGVEIALAAIGGPGKFEYQQLTLVGGGYSGGMGNGKSFNIDTNMNYGPSGPRDSTTSVECELPHVVFRTEALTVDHRMSLTATDDQSRPVRVEGPYNTGDLAFYFLDSAADATSIALTAIVQKGRTFEFTFPPPVVQRAVRIESEPDVARRLTAVSARPLLIATTRYGGACLATVSAADGMSRLTPPDEYYGGGAWAPDGKQIACARWQNQQHDLFLLDAATGGTQQITDHGEDDRTPCWSPDGERLCFCRSVEKNWELFTIKPDGTDPVNLTNDPAQDADPAWSPDGASIAFTSTRDGADYDLFVMDADGGNVRRISQTPNGNVYPAWSPDSRQIAFTGRSGGDFEIFVCDADGQNERQLTTLGGLNSFAAWSPEGKIAFQHLEPVHQSQRWTIYTMNADGTDLQVIAPAEGYSGQGAGRPAWKP